MTSKPDFVIVPGAWHSPESFKPTTDYLTKAGYVHHGVTLPSVGASPPLKSFEPDVEAIRKTLDSILSSCKDVVLLMHSYGGTVGSESLAPYIQKLEEGEKKEGWGRVIRLVYCASFVLPEGGSLMAALNYKPLPWFIIDGDEVRSGTPKEIFYNDLSDSEAEPYIAALKPHSYPTFFSKLTVAPWKVIPSTYIVCANDLAIPIHAQEGMLAMAEGMAPGCFDVIDKCDAGHSPFLSRPEWLAGRLINAAAGGK